MFYMGLNLNGYLYNRRAHVRTNQVKKFKILKFFIKNLFNNNEMKRKKVRF